MSVSSDAAITLTSASRRGAELRWARLRLWRGLVEPLLDWRGISPATGADCSAVAWSSRMFSFAAADEIFADRAAGAKRSDFISIRGPTPIAGSGSPISREPRQSYPGRRLLRTSRDHPPRTRKDQAPNNRKPSLAASTAYRIISIKDDPKPPSLLEPAICLKSSDDGQRKSSGGNAQRWASNLTT
jgi:hypothetical protein